MYTNIVNMAKRGQATFSCLRSTQPEAKSVPQYLQPERKEILFVKD